MFDVVRPVAMKRVAGIPETDEAAENSDQPPIFGGPLFFCLVGVYHARDGHHKADGDDHVLEDSDSEYRWLRHRVRVNGGSEYLRVGGEMFLLKWVLRQIGTALGLLCINCLVAYTSTGHGILGTPQM